MISERLVRMLEDASVAEATAPPEYSPDCVSLFRRVKSAAARRFGGAELCVAHLDATASGAAPCGGAIAPPPSTNRARGISRRCQAS